MALRGSLEAHRASSAQRAAIRACVDDAQGYYPDFQASRHRYYVVDAFTPTGFSKLSAGVMMGHRYLDVEVAAGSRVPAGASGAMVAALLDRKTYV